MTTLAAGRFRTVEGPAPERVAPALAAKIRERYEQHLRGKIHVSNSPTNRASSLGDVCARRRVLRRTRGREATPPSIRLQAIFEQGKRGEIRVKQLLADLGIDLLGSQRDFPPNDYGITGHIDGIAEWERRQVVAEIKTLNAADFDRVRSAEDLKASGKFLRKWYSQVNLYCFLSDIPEYIFVLEGKATGEIKVLAGEIDYEEVEQLLANAEADNAHVAAGTLPDFYPLRSECRKCDFLGHVCQPPMTHGEGVQIIASEEIAGAAKELLETRDAALRNARAKKILDEELRPEKGQELMAIIGDVAVARGKWGAHTSYPMTEELKTKLKRTDPQGTFRLLLEPLAGEEATDAAG